VGHWRSLLDHEFLGAWDLAGKDGTAKEATFTIGAMTIEMLRDPGTGEVKPMLCATPKERPERKLVLKKTNAALIAAMYGERAEGWVGKKITIYPAKTQFGRDRVDCIRVRVPDDLLRTSAAIPTRVRKKLLQERGWSVVQPQTREQRQAPAAEREPGDD
jgi:hypothetical protein